MGVILETNIHDSSSSCSCHFILIPFALVHLLLLFEARTRAYSFYFLFVSDHRIILCLCLSLFKIKEWLSAECVWKLQMDYVVFIDRSIHIQINWRTIRQLMHAQVLWLNKLSIMATKSNTWRDETCRVMWIEYSIRNGIKKDRERVINHCDLSFENIIKFFH